MKNTIKNLAKTNRGLNLALWPLMQLRRIVLKNFSYFGKVNKYYSRIFSNVEGGSLVVSVKNLPGSFEIDSRSHILRRILINKDYEPQVVELIKTNISKNKDAINVGANIGLMSILLGNLIGQKNRVAAIEPTPNAFNHLVRNIARNNFADKIIPINCIAANEPGTFEINTIAGKEEYSSMGEIVHDSVQGFNTVSIVVEGNTIDNIVDILGLQPGIIVVDVEGAEGQVLLGAKKTIRKFKPVLISELNDDLLVKLNCSSKMVKKILDDLDYILKDEFGNEVNLPFRGNIIAKPKMD